MSASSRRDVSRSAAAPVAPWVRAEHGRAGEQERLPWVVAAPLIAFMALACWLAVWKAGGALLSLLLH